MKWLKRIKRKKKKKELLIKTILQEFTILCPLSTIGKNSYNSSFGVYDDCLIGGNYSLSDFPSYDDYIGHIVDDIYDIAYEYELENGEDALYLIEQIIDSTSSEVVEYFGGEDKYRKMLCDMIEAEFGVEIERTKQEDVKHDLRYDEDGYEYDESLIEMFLTPVEKVKYFIQIAEREEVIFTSEQKHLLMYYAKTIDDGDKAVEKARLLAHVIQTAPSLVSKEMNRINYEIDMYENDIYMSQNTEAETHYLPYEDFDDDYDDYD